MCIRDRALAAQWGGRAYPTWEALLADPAIDAVSICAANTAHAELTIAALRAGKHVPVSYTHLDVYKRQTLELGYFGSL